MTPDTLRIDLRFKSVGRINRASGTTVPAVRAKIVRMLRALYEDGRLDILRAIRDGHVTFMQVYDAYKRRALGELPIGNTMPMLAPTMRAWIANVEVGVLRRPSRESRDRGALLRAHDKTARVADLPRVLEELRNATLGTKHPRSFNLARAAALAFVRSTLKRSHPIWLACAAVEQRKVPKRALAVALTVKDMQDRFKNPETDNVDAIAWSLVTTGMGAKEYWGRWQTQSDRIHIAGTKRGGRVRDVPLARAPSVPRLSRDRFERVFRERMQQVITPYDLRRTYCTVDGARRHPSHAAQALHGSRREGRDGSLRARGDHGVSRRGCEEAAHVPRTRFLNDFPGFFPGCHRQIGDDLSCNSLRCNKLGRLDSNQQHPD
jgi:hypothetical protein